MLKTLKLPDEEVDNATKLNLIRLFFEEISGQTSKAPADSENAGMDFSSLHSKAMHKPPEEMNQKELEELEEIKKKEKMKLEYELMEFKKRGGFAKVLHDLFYNPDVSSLEFDSVYNLK